jgi:hypothetical protein
MPYRFWGLLDSCLAANEYSKGSALGVIPPGTYTDSVDGDGLNLDGSPNIDGFGRKRHSYGPSKNDGGENDGHKYTFDAQILGNFPTHVGIIWTDGGMGAKTTFEAFDSSKKSLGIFGPFQIGDGSWSGEAGEDRFFGVINETGISSFVIKDPGGSNSLEVDHLQYGFSPPIWHIRWWWLLAAAAIAALTALLPRVRKSKSR